MRLILFGSLSTILLSGCSRLESIPYVPAHTPETWLKMQPYFELKLASSSLIIVQPSTSAIVYLLGVITLAAGVHFLRVRQGQRTRLWWGVALLLWGAGALFAGTSYEAFSYQIKCAGRQVCTWTSGWEILYLLVSVASMDAMLLADAYSSARGRVCRLLVGYAWLHIGVYSLLVLIGSILPVQFLISFELLILVCAPTIIVFLVLNGRRYARLRQPLDLALLGAWSWLVGTIAAYFGYYLSGLGGQLWANGIWFTENDILHIGLIVWMIYLARRVAPLAVDQAQAAPSG